MLENEFITFEKDKYGPDIYHLNMADVSDLSTEYPDIDVYRKFDSLGWGWLQLALRSIAAESGPDTKETKDSFEQVYWQPLPIDRQNPDYSQSIELAEEALKIIEGDNGYASTEPDERNAMVYTIRGTINAIKEGTPSLEQIKVGLLKPFKYLSKKFGDAAIGAAAKAAVAALVKWLTF